MLYLYLFISLCCVRIYIERERREKITPGNFYVIDLQGLIISELGYLQG
jgi:ribosomal 30S subunit maturation factor RimM